MSIILALLMLVVTGHTTSMSVPKQTIVNVGGGGNDPTKLPLTGGTLTGPTTFQAETWFSTVNFQGPIVTTQTFVTGGIAAAGGGFSQPEAPLTVTGSDSNFLVANLTGNGAIAGVAISNEDPTGLTAIFLSSTNYNLNLHYDPTIPGIQLGFGGTGGTAQFTPTSASLHNLGGGSSVDVFGSSVIVRGNGGGIYLSGGLSSGVALCLCAGSPSKLGYCTTAPTPSCTCSCP